MTREMTIKEIVDFCRETMDEYGLKDWKLIISKRTRRVAGWCDSSKKTIMISHFHLERWYEKDALDCILHEIAHALTPDDPGHGLKWKAKAKELGAIPAASKRSKSIDGLREEG